MKQKTFLIISAICLIVAIVCSALCICKMVITLEKMFELSQEPMVKSEDVIIGILENIEAEPSIESIIEPETKIIERVKEPVEEMTKMPQPQKISMGEFKLTAYCSCQKCCGKWALNRPKDQNGNDIVYGSTGIVLVAGKSIAVDPSVIPYGSTVEINNKKYIADDCGGAIKGKRIDVYFDNHTDALEFGVQYAEIFII